MSLEDSSVVEERIGFALAHALGHTMKSIQPTTLAPNTQTIYDAVIDALVGVVHEKASEIHDARGYGTDGHSMVHSCPCWHEAATWAMFQFELSSLVKRQEEQA